MYGWMDAGIYARAPTLPQKKDRQPTMVGGWELRAIFFSVFTFCVSHRNYLLNNFCDFLFSPNYFLFKFSGVDRNY